MMAAPAAALGVTLRVLVEDEAAPAAQVVPDSRVGAARDEAAIRELVSAPHLADALTFEHEHVTFEQISAIQADGVSVQPPPQALLHAHDKLIMRRRLTELGVPCPAWAEVTTIEDVAAFLAVRESAVLKTPTGGYDGKGVKFIRHADEAAEWLAAGTLLIEEKVDFDREVAALLARTPSGQVKCWPVAQTIQENGVCAQVIAPAPNLTSEQHQQAQDIAVTVAEGLGVTGVLAVEMFQTEQGFVVNELAMRPHNSGHWTIDGAVTSQFEQHLRAVLDLPLGDTAMTCEVAVMANVLGSERAELVDGLEDVTASDPGAKVHIYGKQVRPGRKLGHVTVAGTAVDTTWRRALAAAAALRGRDQQ